VPGLQSFSVRDWVCMVFLLGWNDQCGGKNKAAARTRRYIYRSKQLGEQQSHSSAKHHRRIPWQGISARISLL